ncbi:MAG: hypothetical protein HY824_13945 [Acidobacteria bacterium]|nr:hypothetical protein [Acidobacteriota bacterium]
MRNLMIGAVATLLAAVPPAPVHAQSRPLPAGAFAGNVEVVSFTDVSGHIPFKMSIHQAGGRWYMYAAAQDDRGWSVLDITDPARPIVLNWIPGPANTRTVQVDIAEGRMITGLEQSQRGGDTNPSAPFDDGVLIWSLEDPVHPRLLGQYKTGGGLGTHRNGYYGGRYMHLAAGMRGYAGNIYVIVDISDPAHPLEVSRWAPPEMKLADPNAQNTAWPHGMGLHGPPLVVGNLVYLGFDTQLVVLDISDIRHPNEVGALRFDPPYHGLFSVHTVLPYPNRQIAVTTSEGGCADGPSQTSSLDIADPAKVKVLSFFPTPVPPPGAPYRNFCERSAGFGAHNVNMLFHNPNVDRADNIVYMTYTNAGLRVFDISDARLPREIGYFVPPSPARREGAAAPGGENDVSNGADVIVDTRGYIYMSDRSQGIWVLRYTGPKPGPARPVVRYPLAPTRIKLEDAERRRRQQAP